MAASEAKGFLDFLDDDLKPSQIVIERTKIGKRTTSSGAMGFLSFVEGEQDKTNSPQIERVVSKQKRNQAMGFLDIAKDADNLNLNFPQIPILKETFQFLLEWAKAGLFYFLFFLHIA